MLMAAKTSDRGDDMTEANLQMDGLEERPAQRVADHHETEEEDSSPHNSPTWSPILRLPTGRLNMNYCLSIQATLTDELGDVPPPGMPGRHWWWKICYETLELDIQKQLLLAQVKRYSFMGDVPWERV